MKLKFKKQDFQDDAVDTVAGLFKGQEKANMTFSVADNSAQFNLLQNEFGFGNSLLIDRETLQNNLHAMQKAHSLPQTDFPEDKAFAVSVEMETGTGKTFVYTKTILEMNKRYGFTKFIIVVPSVAIREGVYKSFQVTEDYFKNQYDSVPYRYFIYNSAKLSDVRSFATSDTIQVMIINIDAFKKAENVINQEQDKLNGEAAIRYIQATNPIVIIDEPQSVDNTPKAQEAIASLNPLCVLRYSATHRSKQNLVYRLTPVDAYQLGLVKQISVISNSVINDSNKPYIALKSVSGNNGFSAKIEMDIENATGKVERKIITVKPNDDLFIKSGHRKLYENYVVSGIDCTSGYECIEFANSETVELGQSIGSVDPDTIKRAMIYHTIRTHLDKELRYHAKGIKVLSLFFIDEVKKYRTEDGGKGIYAEMFEECYNELINKPKYADLKNQFNPDVAKAHNGYFSQDKKGKYKDTRGDTQADDDTYNTIMKDKEWLLSFECPLRFIFSHSALKEGWDNPNVFQVCTLIDQKSVFTCRQKIGRGLRLCVNQDGERIEDKDINVLHVVANESFSQFATKLQTEIENETGIRFGIVELSMLIGMTYDEEKEVERSISTEEAETIVSTLQTSGIIDENGSLTADFAPEKVENIQFENVPEPVKQEVYQALKTEQPLRVETLTNKTYTQTIVEKKAVDYEEAAEILETLKKENIITKEGKVKDTMKAQLAAGTLDLSARYSQAKQRAILQVMNKADNRPVIRDASREVTVKLKKQAVVSPEFMELWDKIKQKTTYRVQFDLDRLVEDCVKEIKEMPQITPAKLLSQTAQIKISQSGVYTQQNAMTTQELDKNYDALPDILRLISTKTLLTRSTVNRIIKESGRTAEFLKNPQEFYENVLEIIQRNRHKLAIDGIKYIKLDGEEYYVQEIFDSSELIANLDRNAIPVEHSIYDHVIYDSGIENRFAAALDTDPDVKMFFKIPRRFKIETPIGTYNPDWAVYLEKNGEQKLYFVLETKGTDNLLSLRPEETLKIHCGARHFKALDNVGFSERPVKNWAEFKKTI